MSNYSTGEMAKLCNVSVRTVQFYDQKGVLHPSAESEGGRRIYNDDDLNKLQLICALKSTGLSLGSIKGILESEICGKILTILLTEQEKTLSTEIDRRQRQLEMIGTIKENIGDKAIVSANKIIDVENIMKEKKVRSKFRKMVAISCVISLPTLASIALWIFKGVWVPLAVVLPLSQIFAVLLARHFHKGTAFICPKCNAVFTPSFKNSMLSSGTTKARWLTCVKCGHKGYCIEIITDNK